MSPLFWLDVVALSVSTVIATSLALIVLGAGPSRALNRSFVLFALIEAVWAATSLLLRLDLWLERGDPLFLSELTALAFALMGPLLLPFTARYLDRRTRTSDLVAGVGLATVGAVSIPLFRHQMVSNPHLDVNGSTVLGLNYIGFAAAAVSITCIVWSVVLFWLERRRTKESYLALSVLTLAIGFVVGRVLNVPFPVLSISNTISIAVLGYGVISRQLFNPLREKTAALRAEIAERVRIESQRDASRGALREREESYRTLLDGVPVGLYRVTPSGQILDANLTLVEMLGYPDRDTLLAVNTKKIHVDPEDRSRWQALIEREGVVRDFETRLRQHDDTNIWAQDTARIVRGDEGQVLYYEGSLEDTTERKRLEAQLRQAQKMEAIGRLASGVAHDFNNVLTAIQGYTSLSLSGLASDDLTDCPSKQAMRADLEGIEQAADRAAVLTRQLLAFSRKQVLQPKVLDLNDLVGGIEQMLRRLIGEDIELRAALDPALGRVRADPGQLEQVIMNLAVNARDAMPTGGQLTLETANVELDDAYAGTHFHVCPGPYVVLSVSDTGVGMDKEVLSHLFEPFFTTKEPGKGTGLGLATVYGIVKQSDGYIWPYSEPGRGTTFKVYLPRVNEQAESGRQEQGPVALPRGTETILLVEDEYAVRELVCRILERQGYTVLAAHLPSEAMRLSQQHDRSISLLITDVVMPEMRGTDLAERLVASRPEIKVLYISGYTDDAIARHGVFEPGVAYLEKPFALAKLAHLVREVLDESQGSRVQPVVGVLKEG